MHVFTAVIFEVDANNTDDTIPAHISYKIRMDMSKVDTTSGFKVVDRFAKYEILYFALLQQKYLQTVLCMY